MVEAGDAARGPPEPLLGVPQVGHDEAVLPAALLGAGAAQVGRRARAIVHRAQPRTENKLSPTYFLCLTLLEGSRGVLTDGQLRGRRR